MFLKLGRTQKINISLQKTLLGELEPSFLLHHYKNRSCEMALIITKKYIPYLTTCSNVRWPRY